MSRHFLFAIVLLLASFKAAAAEVSGFRVWADPVKTRAVLDLDRKAEYQLFTLEDPHRVVVDLQGASLETSLELDRDHAGLINGVRYGTPERDVLRVVLDLDTGVDLKSFLLDPTGQ